MKVENYNNGMFNTVWWNLYPNYQLLISYMAIPLCFTLPTIQHYKLRTVWTINPVTTEITEDSCDSQHCNHDMLPVNQYLRSSGERIGTQRRANDVAAAIDNKEHLGPKQSMLNSKEIKRVGFTMVELCLAEHIGQSENSVKSSIGNY